MISRSAPIRILAAGLTLLTLTYPERVITGEPNSLSSEAKLSVFDAKGLINAVAYRRMAQMLATPSGIEFRYGRAMQRGASKGTPTAFEPASHSFIRSNGRDIGTHQVGGPVDYSKDDYSSDQGQVGYISDLGSPRIGVDHIESLAFTANTFSERPQLSWTYYGRGHPEPDLTGHAKTARCVRAQRRGPGRFVAQARAYAHGEATANSLIVLDNGVVAAAGTNTALGSVCVGLPTNLHPSALSITNGNEFALVTAWNSATLRSELGVIALGGEKPAHSSWDFDWPELYPGFQNYGRFTFAKYLGSIVLPMAAATGVAAVSTDSRDSWLTDALGRNVLPGAFSLSKEVNRRTFITGSNRFKRPSGGYAVVFSRAEHKTSFVDLKPLFDRITDGYFGTRRSFDYAVRSVGQSPTSWPKAFSVQPAERPRVIHTFVTDAAPTAAAPLLSGMKTPRAYVALENGLVKVVDVSNLVSSQRPVLPAVKVVGEFKVGLNPTSISYVKDRDTGDALKQHLDDTLIITSRGDRSIRWIRLHENSGRNVRILRDSRLRDPIAAEDNNTHGTESYVLSVADYGAGRVFNYRYGPVIAHTNGGSRYGVGRSGHDQFEYGGEYNPKGHPFSISVTNVP